MFLLVVNIIQFCTGASVYYFETKLECLWLLKRIGLFLRPN